MASNAKKSTQEEAEQNRDCHNKRHIETTIFSVCLYNSLLCECPAKLNIILAKNKLEKNRHYSTQNIYKQVIFS